MAPLSPAGHAGIAAGDLLVSVNGQPAGGLDPKLYLLPSRQRSYTFFRPASHERIDVQATGVDPGIELRRTPESIAANYKPASYDLESLLTLWEDGAFATLEDLATKALAAWKTRNTPALVLLGAAQIDAGRYEAGRKLVEEYFRSYMLNWTVDYAAVARYYVARHAAETGDPGRALDLLNTAFAFSGSKRVADALVALGQPRPQPPTYWLDKTFPGDYELPAIDAAARTLTLSESLLPLAPPQLFLVCALDGYRGNGPYNSFMQRFISFCSDFKPFVAGLHVITEIAERPPDRAQYFQSEDKAKAAHLPFEVLLDANGEISSALSPPGSPHSLALDRKGRVLAEGELNGIDVWRALEKAAAASP